jgi:HTH-type transcriptional regulator/antitoxin HigA
MNKQAQSDQEQYQLALRELSVMFENPPKPGTPAGERFEALISLVEKYESTLIPAVPANRA